MESSPNRIFKAVITQPLIHVLSLQSRPPPLISHLPSYLGHHLLPTQTHLGKNNDRTTAHQQVEQHCIFLELFTFFITCNYYLLHDAHLELRSSGLATGAFYLLSYLTGPEFYLYKGTFYYRFKKTLLLILMF